MNNLAHTPLLQGTEVFRLIPQRPPIVLVDKFFGIEEGSSYAGLTVQEDNLFCEDGVLQEAGLIEHMAQSAAARIGYLYSLQGKEPPLGFIGSIDKLHIYSLPRTDTDLLTTVTVVQEVGDITLIAAQVQAGENVVAACNMKIFIAGDH